MDRFNGTQYAPGPPKHFQNGIPPPPGCPPCPPCNQGTANAADEDGTSENFRPNYPQGMYPQMQPPPGMYQAGAMPVSQQGYAPNYSNAVQSSYSPTQGQQIEQNRESFNDEPSIIGFQAVKLIRKICRKPQQTCPQRRPLYQPPMRKCGCSAPSPPLLCSPMRTCRSSNFQNNNACKAPPLSNKCKNQVGKAGGQMGRLYLCRASDSRDDQVVVLQEIVCEKDGQFSAGKEKPGYKTTSVETHFPNSVGVNTDGEGLRNSLGLASGGGVEAPGLAVGSGLSAGGGLGAGSNMSAGFGGLGTALNGLLAAAGSSQNDGNGNIGLASAMGNMMGMGLGGLAGLNQPFDPAMMAALTGFGLCPPGFGPMPYDLDGRCDEDARSRKEGLNADQCDSCDSFERWRLKCECRKKMREECKRKDGSNDAKADAAKSVSVNTSDPKVAGKTKSSGSVKGKKKDKKGKKGKKKR